MSGEVRAVCVPLRMKITVLLAVFLFCFDFNGLTRDSCSHECAQCSSALTYMYLYYACYKSN